MQLKHAKHERKKRWRTPVIELVTLEDRTNSTTLGNNGDDFVTLS